MRFSVYQESHVGGRKNNQDRMGYSYTRDAVLLVLADGMGGHLQGEVAASIALQTIGARFQNQAQPTVAKPEQFLEDSFFAAHREIHRYRAVNNLPETPRTTIVACLIQNNGAYWAHCGDSRLYWLRRGQLLARTRDHSRVEMLIAEGKLDPSERETHPDRNRLFNCLGASVPPVVEMSKRASLQTGDVILLCSDGLWSVLPDNVIAQNLAENTVVRAVPELIGMATAIGGKNGDNVTALGMMWEGAYNLEDASTIATHTLPVGSVATTIQAPLRADLEQADAFDDAEIEKAIEEIRKAIDKTSRITSKN